ncbi:MULTISPECIES: ZIP family metal transporter [Nocardia]|uniref:ZIP family metal transporter n=1 Tax=Nocardia TaxID=1817 RepID=UPI001895F231|nr:MULTISPECIES: ZIP family metal transporter [Nocardia]MBF6352568.1 ZIP family metal transporter [Nocardia flavorosea]
MGTALLYGLGTAIPLVIGAAIGLRTTLPEPLLASLMAFGAGTMIAAVSNELFEPAFLQAGAVTAGVALFAGAAVYVVANRFLERRGGGAAVGWALMLGTVLDGVPENTALGVTLGSGGGLALLVAIAVGNVPEAIGGSALLHRERKVSTGKAFGLWVLTGVALVVVTVGGQVLSEYLGATPISTIQAFAGGATVAVLADSLMPEAYREGGWWVGIATAAGFLVAFLLG